MKKSGNLSLLFFVFFLKTGRLGFKTKILKFLNEEYLGWTWKEASAAFLQALDVERRVMLIILSLVILVAALNIISGLVMYSWRALVQKFYVPPHNCLVEMFLQKSQGF